MSENIYSSVLVALVFEELFNVEANTQLSTNHEC